MMEVKHFPIHIDNTRLPKAALKIIENIRLDWKAEDVRFKVRRLFFLFDSHEIMTKRFAGLHRWYNK